MFIGKAEKIDNLGDIRVDGNTTLKWTSKKLDNRVRIRLIWLTIGSNGELL
jgi:hypothetical protein